MKYEQKLIQLRRRRNDMCSRCTFWHDAFLKDYKKSLWAYSVEEREDFKTYAKSDYWIYQDMLRKLRQIEKRIWLTENRELIKQVKEIIEENLK